MTNALPHKRPRVYSLLALTAAVFLVFDPLLVLAGVEPPLGLAAGVESQNDPTACETVGNNWTNCQDAFSSNNVYAYANDTPVGPTQFGRPTSTLASGSWTAVGAATHHAGTDEVTPNGDTDYVNSTTDEDELQMTIDNLTDPAANTSHILSFTARSLSGGGQPERAEIHLFEGATQRASSGNFDLDRAAYATHLYTLTTAEADGITDYTNLRFRLHVHAVQAGEEVRVTQAEFEVPSAPPDPGKNDTAWRGFGFTFDESDTVNSVEIGVEWFRISSEPILNVTISWDGGVSWATNQTATNKSVDDNVVEFLDFTSATAWTVTKLNDANLRARVGTNASDARLDYVTVRVNFNTASVVSAFRLEDGGGVPRAGEQIAVDVDHYFIFNVTDNDGWADVGSDGDVTLRLWYDGNTAPELTFPEQTTGANYRIVLKYQDTADPATASLSEWTVTEGRATYNATASSLTAITSGPTLIGYEFRLALGFGFQVKQADDPVNSTAGSYNDGDSWNAEVVANDGIHTIAHQTASTGEHMEFGVFTYTLANVSGNWTVTVGPGLTADTNPVTISRRSNDAFTMKVWFVTDLTKGTKTIPVTNVQVRAAADSNDNITSDTAFAGLGEPNAIFILGTPTWFFNHSVDSDEDTTTVQFGVTVPLGTEAGTYTAPVRVEIEDVDGALLTFDESNTTVLASDTAPVISNFRLEDDGGVSMAGERLDVETPYYFVFNVTDDTGWSDIGADGNVSLRLWYDGNVTPELAYSEQTTGASYRIELRYQDVSDPATATLGEWSVTEGQATYDIPASSLTAITSGSTVIGYEFRLALRLGFVVKSANDPIDNTVGSYNDRDSWNAEVGAGDGGFATTHQTAALGEHMEFGVFANPVLTYVVAVSEATLEPGQSAVFRVNFTNAGPGKSAVLWVNVTFPTELTYLNDDAGLIGGVRSGAYSFRFTDVTPAVYSFNITASAKGGVADGTIAVTNFTFEASDPLGEPLDQFAQSVPVTMANALLDLTLVSSAFLVDPGDTLVLNVTLTNTGSRPAMNLLIEGRVDPNATYLSSSPTGTYDPVAQSVRWTAALLDPGTQVSFQWSVQPNSGTPDLATVTLPVRVDYEDVNGTAFPPLEAFVQATVRAPSFSVELHLDRSTAEHGDEVVATLYYNNTGSGTSLLAWTNWTLGGHYELVALSPALQYTSTAEGFAIVLTNVDPGPHSLVVRLRVMRGMMDELPMGFEASWLATDGNGNLLSGVMLSRVVYLQAPSLVLSLAPAPTSVEGPSVFSLNLTVRNLGRAAGTGWLNLTLPSGVAYVGDNGTFPVSRTADRVTWRLSSLRAGSVLVLGIELQADGNPGLGSFRFALDFTDGRGSPPQAALSNAISVRFLPVEAPPDQPLWWLFIVLPIAAGAALFPVVRRRLAGYRIEEVFVVHRSGMLLTHRSRTPSPERDQDILMAVFQTMRDIPRDALSKEEEAPVLLQHGQFNVLLEQGTHHYAAVVFRGEAGRSLAARLSRLSQRIEEEYGEMLASWEGDMWKVLGIDELIPLVWGKRGRRSPEGGTGVGTEEDADLQEETGEA